VRKERNGKQVLQILPETAGLTLSLEESEHVVDADSTNDVADNGAGHVVNELDADLGDATAGTGAAENLSDTGKLGGSVLDENEDTKKKGKRREMERNGEERRRDLKE
jgi:hypothetical protein